MRTDAATSLDWRGAAISSVTPWHCLDLVNTVEWRLSDQNDFLCDFDDLSRWARHVGLIDDRGVRRVLAMADRSPESAQAAIERARSLRETLAAVLSAMARIQPPPAAALDELNAELAVATVPIRLIADDEAVRREWLDPTDDLDWFLGPVVRSAADFVVSLDVVRLKECPGGPGKACGFLFLDETKNRSRRWCSSRTCGNRARQHRFYTRAQH